MIEMKGRRVTTPNGGGEVLETIGDDVTVKLDNGEVKTYPSEDVLDESAAG